MAIDAASFSSALAAGELDACLEYLRRADESSPDAANLNCRLAEALFYVGRPDEAVECAERAFSAASDQDHVVDFCAWLFSNCERHDRAAECYRALLADRPDWGQGYRHLSGSLAALGDLEGAAASAARASDLLPARAEFALHAGRLLAQIGSHNDAQDYVSRALKAAPDDPEILLAASDIALGAGRTAEAIDLALHAAELAPESVPAVLRAAELMMRVGRYEDAAALLDRIGPGSTEPAVHRVRSGLEMLRGRLDAALGAIDIALHLDPDNAEYWLHRAHLLLRLNRAEEAETALDNAAALDPDNPALRRADLDLLLARGEVTVATAMAGELLRDFPQEPQAAEAARRVIERRLDIIDGDYVVVGEVAAARATPLYPAPGFWQRLHTQRRVVRALMIRETRTRFGDSRLGYGWAVLEPILHLLLLSTVFALLMHGTPPIGTQFFLFYYTGLVPYHLFVHSSSAMTHAIIGNAALLQLPVVTTFDVILARGLLEVATDIVVAVLLLVGMMAFGVATMPGDLWTVGSAGLVIAVFGCGVGFFNGVVTVFYRGWDKVFAQLTRALYFCSGIFRYYVASATRRQFGAAPV